MFFKMAVNNVKRSVRDYTIYFLTLTLAVCIFYTFNSIEAQSVIIDMGKSTASYMETVFTLIEWISVFVSVILGGLILYANQFLIKKRKKELGLYITLGMSKRKISLLLLIETMLIGVASLAIGLCIGIMMSQGLSVATAKLLNADIETYRFIFSTGAMTKTILYFSVIYIIVMLFNQITISKYKLIDLLYASKKNETVKVTNRFATLGIFISSLVILTVAYVRILEDGFDSANNALMITASLGIIGTLLFFMSLSSFVVQLIQNSKSIYFKGINIFVLRQLNYKINTNFLSMTMICLMLFLTITLLFTMIGNKIASDAVVQYNKPVSASTWVERTSEKDTISIEEYLQKIGFTFEDDDNVVPFKVYGLEQTPRDIMPKNDIPEDYMYVYDAPILALPLHEYNALIKQQKKEPLTLQENEVAIVSNSAHFKEQLEQVKVVQLGGQSYNIAKEVIEENIITTAFSMEFFYIILPNSFDGKLLTMSDGMNIMYEDEKAEERFTNLFDSYQDHRYVEGYEDSQWVLGYTTDSVHMYTYGMTATIIFLGIYLGLIFLISSAAVLALQLLSDASDSVSRYESLRKIGVPEALINRAILRQNSIYFFVPLSLALVHSIVGIMVVNQAFTMNYPNVLLPSLLAIGGALVVIYGGYFYATYRSYKYIVKGNM